MVSIAIVNKKDKKPSLLDNNQYREYTVYITNKYRYFNR